MVVDGSREFRRGELGKNSLVPICTKFISVAVSSPTITGGSLSGNNASIKVKRLFAGCPLYRSTSKLRNSCAAQLSAYYIGEDSKTSLLLKDWGAWKAYNSLRFPSLGHMYGLAAEYIFGSWTHAGKVMGLGPFGDPAGLNDRPIVTLNSAQR